MARNMLASGRRHRAHEGRGTSPPFFGPALPLRESDGRMTPRIPYTPEHGHGSQGLSTDLLSYLACNIR